MAAAALLEASKDVLQPLQFRSHKASSRAARRCRLRTSFEETKQLIEFWEIPWRAVGALSNQYLIICVGLSAVLARAVLRRYSIRTELYAIHDNSYGSDRVNAQTMPLPFRWAVFPASSAYRVVSPLGSTDASPSRKAKEQSVRVV